MPWDRFSDSFYALAYANRARAHAAQGEYEKAAEDFTEVISLHPKDAYAHLGRSRLVPPGDPGRLADAIRDVLAAPAPAEGRPGAGRSHADAARELVAVFEAALDRGATPGGPGRVAAPHAPASG